MQPKKSLIYCIIFLTLSGVTGCGAGPQVSACVSDTKNMGFQCYNEVTKQSFFLAYKDSEKYIAFSPADAQSLISFCGQKKAAKISVEKETEIFLLSLPKSKDINDT